MSVIPLSTKTERCVSFSSCGSHLLFIGGSIKQVLGFGQLLSRVVEDSIHVGEVGNGVFYLQNYAVQFSPIDWQRDGQNLLCHFLYALWICSFLWKQQIVTSILSITPLHVWLKRDHLADMYEYPVTHKRWRRDILMTLSCHFTESNLMKHQPVKKSLIVWMKSFSFLLDFSNSSFFFWALSRVFIAWAFTFSVSVAMSWSWDEHFKKIAFERIWTQNMDRFLKRAGMWWSLDGKMFEIHSVECEKLDTFTCCTT